MSLHLLDRCLLTYSNIETQQRFLATDIPGSLASDPASVAISLRQR